MSQSKNAGVCGDVMTARSAPPHGPNPLTVSVVVPTRNRAGLLRGALASMVQQTWPADDYEVIVVDNGSTDATCRVVREIEADSRVAVRHVHEPHIGLHRARHAGAIHARGHLVLYGEDDIVAAEDWVQNMANCFRARPDLAAVGGKISPQWVDDPPDWLFQFGTRMNFGLLGLLDLGDGFFTVPASQGVYGGNFAIRKAILFEVGGFNPDGVPDDQLMYRGDGEMGLQKKIRGMGYEVAYNGKAVVSHLIDRRRMTVEYILARSHREGYSRAYARFRDHGGALTPMLIGTGISAMRWAGLRILDFLHTSGHQRILRQATISAFASDVRHAARILRRKELAEFVLRPDYLDGGIKGPHWSMLPISDCRRQNP